ncbi:MAG: magnesium transporter CorA family protein [Verrucomicrobiales bacterium]|nr:magnesium transporter CorA family protein [Verrucomicrobiae bacterium]MCC6881114.1 magnesium transporter CorA family protein [Verrucomicrobiales bacterium]MCP5552959.1 magnesium transporter CorA family protein [Akkermansiaceae bacterium]
MIRLVTQQGQWFDWNDPKIQPFPDNLVFLDLLNPTKEEERECESWLEYQLPTREEMQEIEESSRMYLENGAIYMTAWVPVGMESDEPDTAPVTFVLSSDSITTVRYTNPYAFRGLMEAMRRQAAPPYTSDGVFLLLMELTIARIADVLQSVESDLRRLNRDVFALDPRRASVSAERDLAGVVKLLGHRSSLVANLRESLLSLSRILQFFLNNASPWMRSHLAVQFRSVARDIKSLDEYTSQQAQEMSFLLESTLGLISIQQNQIIKIFTIGSVLFLPPTLIASIYGMNFKRMPELEWIWGYPFALGLMLVAALIPLVYFKVKKLL